MMFARSGADPALPVGGANMSEPQDAASESIRQTAMPGHGWPAPVADDVRTQRSRSGLAGRRSQHERAAGRGERINISARQPLVHRDVLTGYLDKADADRHPDVDVGRIDSYEVG